jgi:DNA-binding MarR family transcriptional regulator
VDDRRAARGWTFLTNHAHALLCIAEDPEIRLRDLADRVQVTERAAQRLVNDLAAEGYIVRHRHGRRTSYELRLDLPMRHPVERSQAVARLVDALRNREVT